MNQALNKEVVSWQKSAGVATITLNASERRNPLSFETMKALTTILGDVSQDPEVLAIVLTGSGPAFSAGHDLRELVGKSLEEERMVFAACTELMQKIQEIAQPVIAAVNGPALAAGCQLVATCDLAVAAESAVFGTPGVKIGLFCSTPMVAISRAIGRKRALQMLMTGTVIDAHTAADWGLINEVVRTEEVAPRAAELAAQVANASSLTLKIGKQAFYEQIDLTQAEAYAAMGEVMATNAVTCDAQEGITAFLEKRTPVWQGR